MMRLSQLILPYGFVKYKQWWLPFNWEYNLLGVSEMVTKMRVNELSKEYITKQLEPHLDIFLSDEYKFDFTEKFIMELVDNDESLVLRNDDGEIVLFRLYFYDYSPEGTANSKKEWNRYCDKLFKINNISIKRRKK